jgi:glucose/arabinose dehydrogenase
MLFTAACGSDDDSDETPTAAPSLPAATAAATQSATQEPAAAVEPGAYTTEQVFPQLDFDRMVEIEAIPGDDNHAVVLTQSGTAYRFSLTDENEQPSVFLDIEDRIITEPHNEEGLLGIAFPSDYATSRRLYVYYSAGPPRQNTLSRFTATGDAGDPASEQKLIAVDDPFGNHNGGGLEFGPDGMLYVGIGDGGSGGDPQGNGQNTNVLLGKIWRIDVSGDDYTSPPDNPFASGGGAPEIFAYGLRNPWRLTFDTETGDLWTGDVGQGAREEVDLVQSGGNYGWNITEGDLCFEPAEGCDRTGLIQPRAAYGRDDGSCSVTGGYVYRGAAMPELDGWYVYGDYCSGNVWALDTVDPAAEPILISETGLNITSFWQDASGEIYLITFNGGVQRLVRN